MASIFLDKLKEFMELDENDTDIDGLLDISLNAATAYIEHYCNMQVESTTKDYLLDGDGTDTVDLNVYPITDINTITFSGVDQDTTDYYSSRSSIYSLISTFPIGRRNIVINATAGYPTVDDVPADLLLAILKLAEKIRTDAAENRDGVSKYRTSNAVQEDFSSADLPAGVQMILNTHKRHVL